MTWHHAMVSVHSEVRTLEPVDRVTRRPGLWYPMMCCTCCGRCVACGVWPMRARHVSVRPDGGSLVDDNFLFVGARVRDRVERCTEQCAARVENERSAERSSSRPQTPREDRSLERSVLRRPRVPPAARERLTMPGSRAWTRRTTRKYVFLRRGNAAAILSLGARSGARFRARLLN